MDLILEQDKILIVDNLNFNGGFAQDNE